MHKNPNYFPHSICYFWVTWKISYNLKDMKKKNSKKGHFSHRSRPSRLWQCGWRIQARWIFAPAGMSHCAHEMRVRPCLLDRLLQAPGWSRFRLCDALAGSLDAPARLRRRRTTTSLQARASSACADATRTAAPIHSRHVHKTINVLAALHSNLHGPLAVSLGLFLTKEVQMPPLTIMFGTLTPPNY
jgi:hypothetical protein